MAEMPGEHECRVEKSWMFELRWRVSGVARKLQGSHDAGIQKLGFVSHDQGNGCVEKRLFHMREMNTILRL